jgi:type IV pilus assembly protein PilE
VTVITDVLLIIWDALAMTLGLTISNLAEMNYVRDMKMRDKGFTLIELLISLVIIGLLAAIAVPSYTRYTAKSRQSDAQAQLAAVRQAEEIYKFQYGSYTTTTGSLSGWLGTKGYYTFSVIAANATTFTARASGNIDQDTTVDVWTMDQDGTLTNVTNDVNS